MAIIGRLKSALRLCPLPVGTITDTSKQRQVGGKFGKVGKDSLNNPKSKLTQSKGQQGWLIPPGVTPGNWDYVRAKSIAGQYDDFLESDPLTLADWQIINRYLPPLLPSSSEPATIVGDFGCGTGRSLLPLIENGYHGLAVDLSESMLQVLGEKSTSSAITTNRLFRVQANLVELDGLADQSLHHGISMFSTLGMIEGAENRLRFLQHVRRILKPGGFWILHAHNLLFQLRHPGGLKWMLKSALDHVRGKSELGDRTATYRNVNQIFIHSFRRSELKRLLVDAGFENQIWFGIKPNNPQPIEKVSVLNSASLVGWIVVCKT